MTGFAWLGGVAFVASLIYLTYFYAIVLAAPLDSSANALRNAFIDIGLFSVFALHHSLLARRAIKDRLARFIPPAVERSVYVWVASALLVALCLLWQPVPGVMYRVGGVARLLLYALQIVGALFVLRAAGVIDPLELAGIRQATRQASRDELKIVGPFRVVRHPIYLGWMLMVFGAPTMTNNRLLFAVISSAYLILAIPWEEKSLAAAHGDQYRAYQQVVRWRVLPGIW